MPSVPESGNNSVVDSKVRPNGLKIPEANKYTDVTRTSSASFKPPMSKDALVKKKTDTPQADSTWFTPLFYIKNMFGGKPSSESSTTVTKNSDKKKKVPTVKNTSNTAKAKIPKEAVESHTSIPEETRNFMADTAPSVPVKGDHSPRFGFNPQQVVTRKTEKRINKKPELEEEVDANAPKYNALRFVENKSTYLHAPDKRGTTSFRITTSSRVRSRPNSSQVMYSPNYGHGSSKRTRKSPVLGRQSSASPKKKPYSDNGSTTNFPSRLRSKSTPDHSSVKPRLPYNPPARRKRKSSPMSTSPPPRISPPPSPPTLNKAWTPPRPNKSVSVPASQIKVLSSYDYERSRIARNEANAQRRAKHLEMSRRSEEDSISDNDQSPNATSSFTRFFGSVTSDGKLPDLSPTKKAIEDFMGAAMDALSTKISRITKPQDAVESPKTVPPLQYRKAQIKNDNSNTPSTKSETSVVKKSTWFGNFFDENSSPIMEHRMKMKKQQDTELYSSDLSESDLNRKRLQDSSAYTSYERDVEEGKNTPKSGRTPSNKSRSVSPGRPKKNSSPTGKDVTPLSSNTAIQRNSFQDVLKSSSVKNLESKDKGTHGPSFKAILSSLSTSLQDASKPNSSSESYSHSYRHQSAEHSSSPLDKQKQLGSFLKKKPQQHSSKQKIGISKATLASVRSPKEVGKSPSLTKKEGSSFLKSRQEVETNPRGHATVYGQLDSPPKHNTISRSFGRYIF